MSMEDERYPVVSRVAVVTAALEVALVMLWAGTFVMGTGTAHASFGWYVALPLMFLVAPVLVLFASRLALNAATTDAGCLPWALLGINLAFFVAYALMSGGGV